MLARDFGIDHVTLQPAWPVPPPSGRVIPVAPAPAPGEPDTAKLQAANASRTLTQRPELRASGRAADARGYSQRAFRKRT